MNVPTAFYIRILYVNYVTDYVRLYNCIDYILRFHEWGKVYESINPRYTNYDISFMHE